jgi:hypothetical protein
MGCGGALGERYYRVPFDAVESTVEALLGA